MLAFNKLESRVVPLLLDDIDTDQVIPARFLKVTSKEGLGKKLFHDWRYLPDGSPRPEFPLNRSEHRGAETLLAGDNFGCGSSREHAPWALMDFGFRVIIARSFADIFKNNALKNGLLPVELSSSDHARLAGELERDVRSVIEIDLEAKSITFPSRTSVGFEVDAFARQCLLRGVDQLQYLASFEENVRAFESAREKEGS